MPATKSHTEEYVATKEEFEAIAKEAQAIEKQAGALTTILEHMRSKAEDEGAIEKIKGKIKGEK